MHPSHITDERFYTPRAQASTGRSTSSYGIGSSSSESEYATPRDSMSMSGMQRHSYNHPGNLIPPQYPARLSRSNAVPYTNANANARIHIECRDDYGLEGGDVESRGSMSISPGDNAAITLSSNNNQQDVESIFR